MSGQRFSNFQCAKNFASKLFKAKQSPIIRRDGVEWIVVISNAAKVNSIIPAIVSTTSEVSDAKYEPEFHTSNKKNVDKPLNSRAPNDVKLAAPLINDRPRNLMKIEEMEIEDFFLFIKNEFEDCDIAKLSKMKNRLIEIDANSDVLECIKRAIESSKPQGPWQIDVDGIGGSRDAIKRMKGQDFSDIRKRGR